jgi:sRNA-binding regulator protein Hfq
MSMSHYVILIQNKEVVYVYYHIVDVVEPSYEEELKYQPGLIQIM